MKRVANVLFFAGLSAGASAQVFLVHMNETDPRTFGEPVRMELITEEMQKESIAPVPVEVSVMLKKPIALGCQYIYRVTNKSADRTLKLKMYAVPDQQFEEKIKPGASVDLLTNTMHRCGQSKEDRKGDKGCIGCQPSLNITSITVK